MEYSVYDLIQILVKKWYVILLAMCLVGGLSTVTARSSYAQTVKNYEESVSKVIDTGVDTGTLTASYLYDYEMTDLSKYLVEAKRKAAFWESFSEELHGGTREGTMDISELAEEAYAKVTQEAISLLTDTRVLQSAQSAMDAFQYQEPPTIDGQGNVISSVGPLNVSQHLSVELLEGNTVRLTVFGLEEEVSRQILDAYLKNLKEVGRSDYSMEVSLVEGEQSFTPDPVRFTESAAFAQLVMQKPEKAPIMVKTVGTAAVYAFVLSCFLILVVTFVKDSRRKENAAKES